LDVFLRDREARRQRPEAGMAAPGDRNVFSQCKIYNGGFGVFMEVHESID
jgi:hypothetical protein